MKCSLKIIQTNNTSFGRALILVLILMISTIHLNHAFGQVNDSTIALNGATYTIKDLLLIMEQQTEYKFLFNSNDINLNRRVAVEGKSATIQQLLNTVVQDTPISYKIQNKQIILYKDLRKIKS